MWNSRELILIFWRVLFFFFDTQWNICFVSDNLTHSFMSLWRTRTPHPHPTPRKYPNSHFDVDHLDLSVDRWQHIHRSPQQVLLLVTIPVVVVLVLGIGVADHLRLPYYIYYFLSKCINKNILKEKMPTNQSLFFPAVSEPHTKLLGWPKKKKAHHHFIINCKWRRL